MDRKVKSQKNLIKKIKKISIKETIKMWKNFNKGSDSTAKVKNYSNKPYHQQRSLKAQLIIIWIIY